MTKQFHHFIHDVFGDFIGSTTEYLLDLFDVGEGSRFRWWTIGTYSKEIDRLAKEQEQVEEEPNKPLLPALIINPTEMDLVETGKGGQQFYRFPHLSSGMLSRLFLPIYRDSNISILPGFSRVSGTLECLAICNSIYEYLDLKMRLRLFFLGDTQKPIFPQWFQSRIILPNELLLYTFENDVTGESYELDWNNSVGAEDQLVETIGREEKVLPCQIKPWYWLSDISDGSERYGGSEKLPEWVLNFSIGYEVELPTFIIIEELRDLTEATRHINFNVRYGSSHSDYVSWDAYEEEDVDTSKNVIFPKFREKTLQFNPEDYIYPRTNSTIFKSTIHPDGTKELKTIPRTLNNRFYLPLSDDILDSDEESFDLPVVVNDLNYFELSSKFGIMAYGDHYEISDDGMVLTVYFKNITGLKSNDVLEVFYFR